MITKSDFLLFLEAPLHLWAKKNGKYQKKENTFDRHLIEQGYEVEKLAENLLEQKTGAFEYQKVFKDAVFEARADAVFFDKNKGVIDIYEIKSSSNIEKKHLYDATFQALVCEKNILVRDIYLVYLDKEYKKAGKVELSKLFKIKKVSDEVLELREEVLKLREEARRVIERKTSEGLENCIRPSGCPCSDICHFGLPEYPIYDLPNFHTKKARKLQSENILAILDIPGNFPLSDRQKKQVRAVREGRVLDQEKIFEQIKELRFPLNFLDYESYQSAVPLYNGCFPLQQMVFQYSLHVWEKSFGKIKHFAFIHDKNSEPAVKVLNSLKKNLKNKGSVLVWNKTFEKRRNEEMAKMYPEYGEFLKGINERMYDLADIFKKGYFVDPDCCGSWSIKNILPVLVPKMQESYKKMEIGKGDEAMMAWWKMVSDKGANKQKIKDDLFRYCELDTLAMVEILKKVIDSLGNNPLLTT